MKKPKKCCDFGEYDCAVPVCVNGKRQDVDVCIADIVVALNAFNIKTKASCCGHNTIDGTIILDDGRIITITNLNK